MQIVGQVLISKQIAKYIFQVFTFATFLTLVINNRNSLQMLCYVLFFTLFSSPPFSSLPSISFY